MTHSALHAATRSGPMGGASTKLGSPDAAPRGMRFPLAPLLFAAGIVAVAFLPHIRAVPMLVRTLEGVAVALAGWTAIVWALARRRGQALRVEFFAVRSHWVQGMVQAIIMAYWASSAHAVVLQAPLIVAQILYVYAFDALLSWSRGRTWRMGFGPLPIVLSTNLLLWFKDDWYYLQFGMLTLGVLGKAFVTWTRDGRRTHIFNPSALGQFVVACALIATASTNTLTWGREIATTFEVRHMVIVIFLCGLLVQSLFQVTLMTLAAVATLAAINVVYTGTTGLYFFANVNIAAPIFLGVHLLITDPATSPRTNVGKVLFGAFYGLGYFALFRVLEAYEVPAFWDKLLPVPILNLCVPLIERISRSGFLGRVNRAWESALSPGKLNLIHMGVWTALFGTLLATGFLDAPHPGDSIPFWKKAVAEGRPHAGQSLVLAAGAQADLRGSGDAFNELGLICMDGRIAGVRQSNSKAAEYFSQACALGSVHGCSNVAIQFLFLREMRSEDELKRAFEHLEQACKTGDNTLPCYLLAAAYETGHARPLNFTRAIEYYRLCGPGNVFACKGLARIALTGLAHPLNPVSEIVPTLAQAYEAGDTEAGWYLAYMYLRGIGVPFDENKAREILKQCCSLGMPEACDAAAQKLVPDYKKPIMTVPVWDTAFPLDAPTAGAP